MFYFYCFRHKNVHSNLKPQQIESRTETVACKKLLGLCWKRKYSQNKNIKKGSLMKKYITTEINPHTKFKLTTQEGYTVFKTHLKTY